MRTSAENPTSLLTRDLPQDWAALQAGFGVPLDRLRHQNVVRDDASEAVPQD